VARRSDTSLAALLLTTRAIPAEVKALSAREFWALVAVVGDPAELLGCSQAEVAERVGPETAERVVALRDRATALALEVERLAQTGIATVSALDDEYPQRLRSVLGDQAPAVLHAAGPLELLDRGGLGVVGSSDLDVVAAAVAESLAARAGDDGETVVTGGVRDADLRVMRAALAAGGSVIGVLADPLVRTVNDPEVRRAVGEGALCLVTPYPPTAPFSEGSASGRSKLIYALAERTVVVACTEGEGGTWAGAVEALDGGFGRVLAWTGEGAPPGNRALVERGAEPMPGGDEPEAAAEPQAAAPSATGSTSPSSASPPSTDSNQLSLDL